MFYNNFKPEETQPLERKEATPDMFEGILEDPLPDSQGPDSGWMASCYTCGRSFQGIPEESIDRRYYEYRDGTSRNPGKRHSYVISFCWICARLFPPTR